ncbi:MAG TPA: hypothetical protein VFE47_06325 [Tepidisphaeraceae bacterium]|nr:hypothetical protein [Tepidisphaeraceae bacterium]
MKLAAGIMVEEVSTVPVAVFTAVAAASMAAVEVSTEVAAATVAVTGKLQS